MRGTCKKKIPPFAWTRSTMGFHALTCSSVQIPGTLGYEPAFRQLCMEIRIPLGKSVSLQRSGDRHHLRVVHSNLPPSLREYDLVTSASSTVPSHYFNSIVSGTYMRCLSVIVPSPKGSGVNNLDFSRTFSERVIVSCSIESCAYEIRVPLST